MEPVLECQRLGCLVSHDHGMVVCQAEEGLGNGQLLHDRTLIGQPGDRLRQCSSRVIRAVLPLLGANEADPGGPVERMGGRPTGEALACPFEQLDAPGEPPLSLIHI